MVRVHMRKIEYVHASGLRLYLASCLCEVIYVVCVRVLAKICNLGVQSV